MLKFLSKHEVKLTAAASAPYFVEAVAPVYAKESEHRQIYSRTLTEVQQLPASAKTRA